MIEANIAASDDWFQGEDKSLVFTIVNSSGGTQDITAWTLSWVLKRYKTDTDANALLTKTTTSGIALTTPGSGICTVTIEDTDTWTSSSVNVPTGTYFHELKRTGAGVETILSGGTAVLKAAVHKA